MGINTLALKKGCKKMALDGHSGDGVHVERSLRKSCDCIGWVRIRQAKKIIKITVQFA
jgi:hypothetical protein